MQVELMNSRRKFDASGTPLTRDQRNEMTYQQMQATAGRHQSAHTREQALQRLSGLLRSMLRLRAAT